MSNKTKGGGQTARGGQIPSLGTAYDALEAMRVKVAACKLEETPAISTPAGLLAIDYSQLATGDEELEVLLHEIGHFGTMAFYPVAASRTEWQRAEARAARYVFETYYPPALLAAQMAAGHTQPWELAERLGLPARFVAEMLTFYTEVRGVHFGHLVEELRAAESALAPAAQNTPPPRPGPAPLAGGKAAHTASKAPPPAPAPRAGAQTPPPNICQAIRLLCNVWPLVDEWLEAEAHEKALCPAAALPPGEGL